MQRFYFTLCTKDRADAACKAARSVCMAEDLFYYSTTLSLDPRDFYCTTRVQAKMDIMQFALCRPSCEESEKALRPIMPHSHSMNKREVAVGKKKHQICITRALLRSQDDCCLKIVFLSNAESAIALKLMV
jgi:hypothetical protein